MYSCMSCRPMYRDILSCNFVTLHHYMAIIILIQVSFLWELYLTGAESDTHIITMSFTITTDYPNLHTYAVGLSIHLCTYSANTIIANCSTATVNSFVHAPHASTKCTCIHVIASHNVIYVHKSFIHARTSKITFLRLCIHGYVITNICTYMPE